MTKAAKSKSAQFVVWVILGLLVVALAGFGTGGFGNNVTAIGKVGNTEISVDRYANILRQELRELGRQTGQTVTIAQAEEFGLTDAVLAQTVGLAALEEEAAALGLSVGDEIVSRLVLSDPRFTDLSGAFDRQLYARVLSDARLSEQQFEESIRRETARNLLQGAVMSGVETPESLTAMIYSYARESRDISAIRLTSQMLETPIETPSAAQLAAQYDNNPEAYTLPERRMISYVWVTPDQYAEEIEIDEDALRTIYESRRDEFIQPERRLVERLVFGTDPEAQAARDAIDAGETSFDTLVEERGLTLDDIDLGDVSQAELGDAGPEVFAVAQPDLVGPVTTSLGPALIRVNAILNARTTSFDQARDDLRREAAIEAARAQIAQDAESILDLLASGATLEDVASDTLMAFEQTAWTGDSRDGIAAYEAFHEAAAKVTAEDFPDLIDLDDGGLFALRLDEIRPPQLQPIEEVSTRVEADWRQKETLNALEQLAQQTQTELAANEEFTLDGAETLRFSALARDDFIQGMPLDAVTAAFAAQGGEIITLRDGSDLILLRVDLIRAPDLSSDEAQAIRESLAEQTARGYAQDMIDAFTRATQSKTGIEINRAAIQAVHAQFP